VSAPATKEVALSLGSNLGDRRGQLARALRGLERDVLSQMEVSSVWETEAVEVDGPQPAFLNLCVVGRTLLTPEQLLKCCRGLEEEAGRPAGGHGLPRTLDLDLLYHGEELSEETALRLPHPGLERRRFVLAPLAELRPDWCHPRKSRSVRQMLAGVAAGQPATRLDSGPGWWRGE